MWSNKNKYYYNNMIIVSQVLKTENQGQGFLYRLCFYKIIWYDYVHTLFF